MDNLTISIFGNQIFAEIANEIKLFSKFKIKYYDDINLCIKTGKYQNQIVIFFKTGSNNKDFDKVIKNNFPLILITKFAVTKKLLDNNFTEKLYLPFSILN